MENYNLEQFRGILKKITQDIFLNVCTQEDVKDICGFSLFSDGDASSISAAYNTQSYLKKKWASDPDEDKEYYRWYPAEWKLEGIESKDLDGLSRMLFEVGTSDIVKGEGNFQDYRNATFSSIVKVLEELKEEGLFSSMSEKFILVFSVSDYESKDDEIKWVKILNNEEASEEFENWTNGN